MMVTSFVRRRIDVTFFMGTGTDGQGPPNIINVKGLRTLATINVYGQPSVSECKLRIYGLSLSMMNELSGLMPSDVIVRQNKIIVSAGDDKYGMATVFQGGITAGWSDLNSAPEAILNVTAQSVLFYAIQPADPISYSGSVDVSVVLAGIAKKMGLGFENNGVSVQLSTPYVAGSPMAQAVALVKMARIDWNCCDNGVLAIWPHGGSRQGAIPLISKDTGMIGYPAYTGSTIEITTIFNNALQFGGNVQVKTSNIKPADGTWFVSFLAHEIESEMPNGAWLSRLHGVRVGYVNAGK